MSATTFESVAAFRARAKQFGFEDRYIARFEARNFAAVGRYAFAIVYSPLHTDEALLIDFLTDVLGGRPGADQLACLRWLFFESHSKAVTDVRMRIEPSPDPAASTRKLATAERVAHQEEQEARLDGIMFTPETTSSNHLVDLYVEMLETGTLVYVKPEQCCSRAQEVSSIKRDATVSTDAAGMLKVGSKSYEPNCEANTELKLRAAWQRRSLAMDLAGIASVNVDEGWVQLLFTHLLRDQPSGYSTIGLQQILDCDQQLFTLASRRTMGTLQQGVDQVKPLDKVLGELKESSEVLEFLSPLPAVKQHEPPSSSGGVQGNASWKRYSTVACNQYEFHFETPTGCRRNLTMSFYREEVQKVEKPIAEGGGKSSPKGNAGPKVQLPGKCASHDNGNGPRCFDYQNNKCKFKGPAGKRCARENHKCYKKGCHRLKPYSLCTHTD